MTRPYTEILISEEAGSEALKNLIQRLVSTFNARIINSIQGPDTDYVDIEIEHEKITVHSQTFTGISIFPTALGNASQQANALVEKVGRQLSN